MVEAAKRELRSRLRAARRALAPTERARASEAIAARCRARLEELAPVALASYFALPDEVDLAAVHAWWWSLGRPLWLPRVVGPGALAWHPIAGLHQVRVGAYGIREPDPEAVPSTGLPAALPDSVAILVPGVGFTADGHRLGQGGGFYDRVLAGHRGPTIGVAFACQRVDAVPRDAHDRVVDQVIFGD